MAQWDLTNLTSLLLDTQTDADSPGSERLMKMTRWFLEALLILGYSTGDSGSATENPPDDNTGVLTDSGAAYDVDEHNGRTLLITSGLADGMLFIIDDTTATTIVCTGDNLYDAGVRSGDTYKVFYRLKSASAFPAAHNHDGVNSTPFVGVISQAALKTTTGSISAGASGNQALPGGEYGFYPQTKVSSGNGSFYISNNQSNTSYITIIGYSCSGITVYAQQRYVQSSGEVHWLFILRDKITKEIIAMYQAPDHPCFGNGGDPDLLPHPFLDYVSSLHEIIVVNPTKQEVMAIRKAAKAAKKDFLEIVIEDFNIDESEEAAWSDEEVTIYLDLDLDTDKYKIKKAKIPKPDMVKCYKLKKKGS